MGVLVVLVQRNSPRDLLGGGVDLHVAAHAAQRGQNVAGDGSHRTVRALEREPFGLAIAVLSHRLVRPQVKRGHERAGAVGGGQRQRFPPACRQPQRAACCSCGSGGASFTASLPRT